MKVLRGLGKLLVVVAFCVAVFFAVMRLHDGPYGMVAGGPFTSGEWVTEPFADMRFARDISTIEFQLLQPARSRTTWVAEYQGRLFIPSGYMNGMLGKIWKHWPHEASEDGRIVARIDGKRYPRQLVRVMSGPEVPAVLAELQRKYNVQGTPENVTAGDLWLFEMVPRSLGPHELH